MNKPKTTRVLIAVSAFLGLLAGGCATVPEDERNVDPLENTNRKIYDFNQKLDEVVLEPVADAYSKLPQPVRNRVRNFFDNVAYLNVILNDFLQGKVHQGVEDTTRFVYNSTFGLAGLFDVATHMGLPAHDEDFGQTLGVWGVGEGAYLTLPVLGPNTLRDAPDLVVRVFLTPLYFIDSTGVRAGLAAVDGVDTRARAAGAFAFINEAALDPYVFTREAYLQRRTFLIYDGNPPRPEFFDELDEFEDEELEEPVEPEAAAQ